MNDSGGLYLEVSPAGGRLWRWKYRFDSKEKLMAFGKYPEVSLAMARERHGQGRKLLACGVDPMAKRKADRTAEQVSNENSKVNYARIDARELPGLLRHIEAYPGTHVTRLAMKLMALTFVRTSELIGTRWDEFDSEAARWDIPAERMKMRTPHIVPLAKQALELLEVLRGITGNSEWLFPGDRNAGKPMSNNTILKGLERMGYKGKMTGHGFRGLASTVLHEKG